MGNLAGSSWMQLGRRYRQEELARSPATGSIDGAEYHCCCFVGNRGTFRMPSFMSNSWSTCARPTRG